MSALGQQNNGDDFDGHTLERAERGTDYQLHLVDETTFPRYYLFIAASGGFYIMRESSSGSLLYARSEFGSRGRWSDFWSKRTTLTYLSWDANF